MRTLLVLLLAGAPFLNASDSDDKRVLDQVESRLQQEPSNPRLWTVRGIALGRLGRIAESLESFDKALAISPKFLSALEGAAEVAYRLGGPRASDYIARILRQEPRNATAHAMAGAISFEARNCGDSVDHFNLAGSAVETSPDALAQWGECLLALDRPGPAAVKLGQSLALRSGDNRVRFDLAIALHLSGREEEALAALKPLPVDARTINMQASIYVAQNRFAEAITAFRKAIEIAPKDEMNYIDLASLCLDHQSFDVASDIVNAGLIALPKSAALYTLRGAIAAQFSKTEEAAADFERANRLQPDQFYSDAGLSLLLEQQDQVDQAIAIVRLRLQKFPNNPAVHFLLADLLLRSQTIDQRRQEEAKSHLIEAIRLQPDLGKAHAQLGKLQLREGNASKAVIELKIALRYDPGDRIAINQLVLALRKLGRAEEARAAADQLRELLDAGRREEVKKNSVRFVRPSPLLP